MLLCEQIDYHVGLHLRVGLAANLEVALGRGPLEGVFWGAVIVARSS